MYYVDVSRDVPLNIFLMEDNYDLRDDLATKPNLICTLIGANNQNVEKGLLSDYICF